MSALIFLVISAWGEEIYSVFYLNWLIIRGFYLNLQQKTTKQAPNRLQGQAPLEYRPTKKERIFYRHTELSYAATRRA